MQENLKQQLYSLCKQYVDQRIANAQLAINNAKESANDETKSSAGDKHETGRAMAQLEQEKGVNQLNESLELQKALQKINIEVRTPAVKLGSVVHTDKGSFFISIPAGKLSIADKIFFAISPASPIGSKLKNLKAKDTFDFNGQVYTLTEVL